MPRNQQGDKLAGEKMQERPMAKPEEPEVDHLDVPEDVGRLLDAFAADLSREFLFPVNRQQAFERLVRVFIPEGGPDADAGSR